MAVLQTSWIKSSGPQDDLMNAFPRLVHDASQLRVRNEVAQQEMKCGIKFDKVAYGLGSKALFLLS